MMDANGENMDRRLRKEIHAREHTIDARLHQPALLESRSNPFKFLAITTFEQFLKIICYSLSYDFSGAKMY